MVVVRRLLELQPGINAATAVLSARYVNPERMAALRSALLRAGLPEHAQPRMCPSACTNERHTAPGSIAARASRNGEVNPDARDGPARHQGRSHRARP